MSSFADINQNDIIINVPISIVDLENPKHLLI